MNVNGMLPLLAGAEQATIPAPQGQTDSAASFQAEWQTVLDTSNQETPLPEIVEPGDSVSEEPLDEITSDLDDPTLIWLPTPDQALQPLKRQVSGQTAVPRDMASTETLPQTPDSSAEEPLRPSRPAPILLPPQPISGQATSPMTHIWQGAIAHVMPSKTDEALVVDVEQPIQPAATEIAKSLATFGSSPQPSTIDASPKKKQSQLKPNTEISAPESADQTQRLNPNRRVDFQIRSAESVAPTPVSAPPLVADIMMTDDETDPAEFGAPTHTDGLRSGTQVPAPQAAPPTHRPQAVQVAQQLAVALSTAEGGTTELALNPEELGRVRLSLKGHDGTISVSIIAERPETSDLMRRNLDALTQEFQALGFTDVQFHFGGDQGQGAEHASDDQIWSTGNSDLELEQPVPPPDTVLVRAGLDLKL